MHGGIEIISTQIHKSSSRVHTADRFERHNIIICTHAVQWCGKTHIHIYVYNIYTQTTAAAANRIDGKFGPFSLYTVRVTYIDRRMKRSAANGK